MTLIIIIIRILLHVIITPIQRVNEIIKHLLSSLLYASRVQCDNTNIIMFV